MYEILDTIYIWVFLVSSESVLILAFVKYMFYSHCTETVFLYVLEAKNTCFETKNCSKSSYTFYLFYPKNSKIDSKKISITQEQLLVESCPTPVWIAFLILCQLVYNLRSYFNELILAWSAYLFSKFFCYIT